MKRNTTHMAAPAAVGAPQQKGHNDQFSLAGMMRKRK